MIIPAQRKKFARVEMQPSIGVSITGPVPMLDCRQKVEPGAESQLTNLEPKHLVPARREVIPRKKNMFGLGKAALRREIHVPEFIRKRDAALQKSNARLADLHNITACHPEVRTVALASPISHGPF